MRETWLEKWAGIGIAENYSKMGRLVQNQAQFRARFFGDFLKKSGKIAEKGLFLPVFSGF